ncbi:amidase signature enzyme [Fistulina hepatica ATCC 64428]|uniref:Amidase signature enzyme n=1 Tax=Fistulina hepatica ATCC 64428 TaxID=1128425 RepID=A0A0D7A4J7_9AGAR|nr:amidase signature enzyme [Fistulina hepatica ATCC 64428]
MSANAQSLDLYETSIPDLQEGLRSFKFTSVDLVKAYLSRIDEVNLKGPSLRAVLEVNPRALQDAEEADSERQSAGESSLGFLHGIPILVKDSIATARPDDLGRWPGSLALSNSIPPIEAHVVGLLRKAGAIILGKTSLSEWSNYRGEVPSGFCGRIGQCTCPYYPQAGPSGSSSGSGVATAIGLAAAALGVETDGSIVGPASRNNIVGLKPTVGLTSRAGVIPISIHQDSVGPMCRSVTDVAILLGTIAGKDPRDPYTLAQPAPVGYLSQLDKDALRGARLGVPRAFLLESFAHILPAFEAAIELMRDLGSEIVDPADLPDAAELMKRGTKLESLVMETDFKIGLEKYLSELRFFGDDTMAIRTLADIVKFNKKHADQELIPPYHEDQTRLIKCQERAENENYHSAVVEVRTLAGTKGIDATLDLHRLDAFILPTEFPLGFISDDATPSSAEPTIEFAPALPYGLCFIGRAWSEAQLLALAYAFEQATQTRLSRKAYPSAIPKTQLHDVV